MIEHGKSLLRIIKRCDRCSRLALTGFHHTVRGYICNDYESCVATVNTKKALAEGRELKTITVMRPLDDVE